MKLPCVVDLGSGRMVNLSNILFMGCKNRTLSFVEPCNRVVLSEIEAERLRFEIKERASDLPYLFITTRGSVINLERLAYAEDVEGQMYQIFFVGSADWLVAEGFGRDMQESIISSPLPAESGRWENI